MTVLLCILSLLFCALLSVAYGSKAVSFQTVFRSLFHFASDSFDASVVQARIPRTVFWNFGRRCSGRFRFCHAGCHP